MNHNTIVGVDLAKEVIQVCIVKQNKVHSNIEMTQEEFTSWLASNKPVTVVFEACGMSNYWKQTASRLGHNAKIISAKLVAQIRQNQKTDKNDALAIVQASQLTDINFIQGKTLKQQERQSMIRIRDLALKNKVAYSHQLKALLLEFNLRPTKKQGGLKGLVERVLEDADNGFSAPFRAVLKAAWTHYEATIDAVNQFDKSIEQSVNNEPDCHNLLALESVGPINAVNLYISIGCGEMGHFKKGRDASACIGVTPILHSSGGKTKLGSIGKYVKNQSVRKNLISGAMAVVNKLANRDSKTTKEVWLKGIIERRGKKCAAVALANKTVRTAFAMLTQGTEYKAEPLCKNVAL